MKSVGTTFTLALSNGQIMLLIESPTHNQAFPQLLSTKKLNLLLEIFHELGPSHYD